MNYCPGTSIMYTGILWLRNSQNIINKKGGRLRMKGRRMNGGKLKMEDEG
jgi:hypothetical protein